MKILKEAKENLPIAFLTNFVSEGWDKVGILKEELEAIKKEYKGTKKVEELIQALIDAYLVCIGQMEQHLADKDYLDIDNKEDSLKESLKDGKVDSHELEIIDKLISKFRNEYKLEGKELYDACIKAGMTKEEVNAFVISDEELKENLQEDVNINIDEVKIIKPEVEIEHEDEMPAVNLPVSDMTIPKNTNNNYAVSDDEMDAFEKAIMAAKPLADDADEEPVVDDLEDIDEACKKKEPIIEACDWFCDFDAPTGDKLTDNDLYPENN